MRRNIYICLLLAGITLVAFWPVTKLGFIVLDDPEYVTDNPNIQHGFTADSVVWAFTTTRTGNWHPVTWLSHILDYKLFGSDARGHHWMNLGIHIANVLLLFVVLRNMTGAVWRSALVAALFAWHPLRIESVAWISERKDVLSAFFMMLTLLCYTKAVTSDRWHVAGTKPVTAPSPVTCHSSRFYWLSVLFFALGLMSKPMLVSTPLVLLLLDFWPLRRIPQGMFSSSVERRDLISAFKLFLEKVPFFGLSLGSSIVTVYAQGHGQAISDLNHVPLDARFENVIASYAAYLGRIFWPADLSIFYPYVNEHSGMIFAFVLLAGISALGIWRARLQPCLITGWFWFLVMLLPVVGIVQVGRQFIADRYTYLPSIGIFLVVVWGTAALTGVSRFWRAALPFMAIGLLAACLLDTRYQLRYWRNSITLFSHSIEITPEQNCVGYWILGNAYLESGDMDAAVKSYQSSIQIAPDFQEPYFQLGYVLLRQNKFQEAEVQLRETLRLNENNADAHACLGYALIQQRNYVEAAGEYSKALTLKPDDDHIKKWLAVATLKAESETALARYYEMLKANPTPEVHVQIAAILTIQEKFQEATEHYLAALKLEPDSADVLNNFAWLLATCSDPQVRNGAQAVKYAERACELTHYRETMMVGTLAAAYAEAGRFDDAISTAQKACSLASESGQQPLLKRNQELLELYRQHQPYHEATRSNIER